MKLVVVFCCFWLFTTHAFANTEKGGMITDKNQLQKLDIEYYFSNDEIKVINNQDKDFIALVKEETTGFPKGIAFIVPEIDQVVTNQPAIKSLYDNLNDYGWTSILLPMPVLDDFGVPADAEEKPTSEQDTPNSTDNTSNTEQAAENIDSPTSNNDNQEADTLDSDVNSKLENPNPKAFQQESVYSDDFLQEVEKQIQQRVEAAWNLGDNYPGFFLFICQGKSCAWLTSLFQQQKLTAPDAMIMLSAHVPQQDLSNKFASELSKTEFPVLDLVQQVDNSWVVNYATQRRKMARKNYKTNYRQRKLFSSVDYYSQRRRTIKEIYGFLTAVGM